MRIKERFYEDYLKRNRFDRYEDLLIKAKESGYKMMGILDFYQFSLENGFSPTENYIIVNRHDIDTSPKTARCFFEIEKLVFGNEGSATYYFRDKTIDKGLISDIENYGYETGYHYEEIAIIEKRKKEKTRNGIFNNISMAQKMFLSDIEKYRKKTETKSLTIASHGDFINTKYQIQNYEMLHDDKVRKKAKILLEAYDNELMRYVTVKFADQVLLGTFADRVMESIIKKDNIILLLTHPRNWKVAWLDNTLDNLKRVKEGIAYKFG